MHSNQEISCRHVILKCPSCEQSFTCDSRELKAGDAILCANCQIHFICGSRELLTALEHIARKNIDLVAG